MPDRRHQEAQPPPQIVEPSQPCAGGCGTQVNRHNSVNTMGGRYCYTCFGKPRPAAPGCPTRGTWW